MPRDIPLANGSMLVCFDRHYCLRDLYYPHIGQENHAAGRPFHFGVWADGRLSWVHDDGWRRRMDYEEDTLVSRVELRHDGLGLELVCSDAVDFHVNAYLRHVTVRNLQPRERVARFYFHQDFNIFGNEVGDTAYFDPTTRALVHYKGARYFLVNVCGPDACGIGQFATGAKNRPGYEGTWRDAEDGRLGGNPIAQGSVDSTLEIEVALPAGGEAGMHYWIVAGTSHDEVLAIDRMILSRTPGELIQRTRDYWRCWVNKEDWRLDDLPPAVARLFKRSLLIARTQVDDHGPVLAANDTDYLSFSRDTYSYCWPRDGAIVCRALDMAGYAELTAAFFKFCASVVRADGYLMHKYNPDGTVASSWHPWVDTAAKLPIQEDESALVLWSLWKHYDHFRDIEFIRPLYKPLIIRMGDFLMSYRDEATGLPLASWDLWEERCGVHAFTCGAVWGGLDAARRFAAMFGQADKAATYAAAQERLRAAMDAHLYLGAGLGFARSLLPREGGGWRADDTADSACHGLWLFGAYAPGDPRMVETARRLDDRLKVRTAAGGLARYEGDPYFRVNVDGAPGNPWFISTLWAAEHRLRLATTADELARDVLPALEWTAAHALPSGVLPEQIHPVTGEALSVSPLTWSHAAFVDLTMTYLAARSRHRRCPVCDVAPPLTRTRDGECSRFAGLA